jgi:hypothetical protein
MQPWGGPKPAQPWDVLQADGVLQFYPWRQLVFESWGRFQVPFWNHYELAGTPLLANSQSAAFYPPHILMGVLHVPTALAMTLLAWFHLAWAGLGTCFLARQLGASRLGGTVAGLSFILSAFMVSWTGLPSVITTVAWIPWLLFLSIRLFQADPLNFTNLEAEIVASESEDQIAQAELQRLGNSKLRRFNRTTLLLALAGAMMILAGHLQFVAYGFMSAFLVALWSAPRPKAAGPALHAIAERFGAREAVQLLRLQHRFFPWIHWVMAVVAALALGSIQLQPVLDYSKYSHRRNVPTEEGYAGYQASAIKPFELIGVVHPNLVGSPTEPVRGIETPQPLSSYWPEYVKRGANFAEGAIGVGPVVLGLLCGLFAFRRFSLQKLGGIALVGVVGLMLATGTALGKLLYFGVPGWSSTGSPGRAAVLFVLALCVLGGVGCGKAELQERDKPWRRYIPAALVALLGFVSIYAAMFALSGLQPLAPLNAEVFSTILASATEQAKALAGLSTLVAAGSLAFLASRRTPDQSRPSSPTLLTWEKGVALFAVVACFFLSVPQVLHFSDSANLETQAYQELDLKPYERVANFNSQWELWMAAQANLPPNTGSLSRMHELGGYDSLIHRDTVALIKDIDAQDPPPMANGNMMFVKPTATPEKLADAGVSAISFANQNGFHVQRIKSPGRAFSTAGPAEITYEDAGQIRLRATGPGRLTLKDRNMPGWTATVDGNTTAITGKMWREVELPEGEHEVVMNYVAPGYSPWLALVAWLVAGIALAASFKRDR